MDNQSTQPSSRHPDSPAASTAAARSAKVPILESPPSRDESEAIPMLTNPPNALSPSPETVSPAQATAACPPVSTGAAPQQATPGVPSTTGPGGHGQKASRPGASGPEASRSGADGPEADAARLADTLLATLVDQADLTQIKLHQANTYVSICRHCLTSSPSMNYAAD